MGLGCVPKLNYKTGSGNQVFTRILTKKQFTSNYSLKNFPVAGTMFFVLDLRAMERLPYSYLHDRAGVRNPHYKKGLFMAQKQRPIRGFKGEDMIPERPGFTQVFNEQVGKAHPLNETMFDLTLGAQYIRRIVVSSEEDRQSLLDSLKKEKIFDINGIPIEETIQVSSCLVPEMVLHCGDDQAPLVGKGDACKYA
jgi:hypothetical protein